MTLEKRLTFVAVVAVLCCFYCCSGNEVPTPKVASSPVAKGNEGDQLDQETIMMICNETFRTVSI